MVQPDHATEPAGSSRSPLFGRERELDLLKDAFKRACSGNGNLVLISGEAGIGKTALIRAISEFARSQSVPVHTSACYDLSVTPPYRPWMEIFDSMGAQINTQPFSGSPDLQPREWISSQDALFTETIDILAKSATERTLILVLEDLHWADSATLELLRYTARQVGGMHVLILVTYRDNEIDRQHPFHLHLPALIREAGATRISLRPLDESSIEAMLEQRYALHAADRSRLLSYLLQRTEGSPFFIEEVLRSLEENDVLTRGDDRWKMSDLRQIPVPALVRQVIDNRLARMDPGRLQLLSVAAAIGQDVSLDIWQRVSHADDDILATTILEATHLSILEETDSSGMMQFTHALIREALYYEIPLPERRSLHRAVAEALQQVPSVDPDAIAWHLQQAQDPHASYWLVVAGERAQQLYAWRTAAERFSAALELIGEDTSLTRVRGWISYRIGLLLTYADAESGIVRMQSAEHLAEEAGDDLLRAYARADRGLLRCLTGDVRRGLAELRTGVEAISHIELNADTEQMDEGDHLSVAMIQKGAFRLFSSSDAINVRQGPLVFWLAWAGHFEDALSIGNAFVENASRSNSNINDALGDCLAGLGHALAALGRPQESLNAFGRARDTFGAIDHHFKVGNTAIYELSEAFLPYQVDRIMEREWLANQAEAY